MKGLVAAVFLLLPVSGHAQERVSDGADPRVQLLTDQLAIAERLVELETSNVELVRAMVAAGAGGSEGSGRAEIALFEARIRVVDARRELLEAQGASVARRAEMFDEKIELGVGVVGRLTADAELATAQHAAGVVTLLDVARVQRAVLTAQMRVLGFRRERAGLDRDAARIARQAKWIERQVELSRRTEELDAQREELIVQLYREGRASSADVSRAQRERIEAQSRTLTFRQDLARLESTAAARRRVGEFGAQRLALARRAVELATAAAAHVEAAHEAGRRTTVDLDDARREVLLAELRVIELRREQLAGERR